MQWFLHIGLHKTASTYFQKEVFPHWPNICYLGAPHQKSLRELLLEEGEKLLLSREDLSGNPLAPGGSSWAAEHAAICRRLGRLLPTAKVMISFRRQDRLLASLYGQYIQQGGTLPFGRFFDVEKDAGVVKRRDLLFRERVEAIIESFHEAPFIFLYEELVTSKRQLLERMAAFLGEPIEPSRIRDSIHNRSLGAPQARLLRWVNHFDRTPLHPRGVLPLTNPVSRRLGLDPRTIFQRHLQWISGRRIELEPSVLDAIASLYADDWRWTLQQSEGLTSPDLLFPATASPTRAQVQYPGVEGQSSL
ncbi:MAG TPA: hypothetical protein VMT85_11815 [Thermoanaerobaculia bacterium]|nr:hypothetical protein [Thermoanaerobaculia bacterium]